LATGKLRKEICLLCDRDPLIEQLVAGYKNVHDSKDMANQVFDIVIDYVEQYLLADHPEDMKLCLILDRLKESRMIQCGD
jgi:hypothetical protein